MTRIVLKIPPQAILLAINACGFKLYVKLALHTSKFISNLTSPYVKYSTLLITLLHLKNARAGPLS
jgi:hypothetical protein